MLLAIFLEVIDCLLGSSIIYLFLTLQRNKLYIGFTIAVCLLIAGCSANSPIKNGLDTSHESAHSANFLAVKYRNDPVDVGSQLFDSLDTSKSSWIENAWYDTKNEYMIINLSGTNYHYCGLPSHIWLSFKEADSFGSYFNSNIKEKYDCRTGTVPVY